MKAYTNEEMEMHIWEYIDGQLSGDERQRISELVASHAAWKSKYAELLALHQGIDLAELDQPSMRFTRNVMEEIAKYHIAPATREYINKKIIWSIAGFFVTIILAFVVYGISQVDWSAGTSGGLFDTDLRSVDYSPLFNNTYINFFLMANVVAALFLLDRVLSQKRKNFHRSSGSIE